MLKKHYINTTNYITKSKLKYYGLSATSVSARICNTIIVIHNITRKTEISY